MDIEADAGGAPPGGALCLLRLMVRHPELMEEMAVAFGSAGHKPCTTGTKDQP